jgi:hypothetical protein
MNKEFQQTSFVGQNACTYSQLAGVYGANTPAAGQYTVPLLCPNSKSGPSYPPRHDTFSHGLTTPICGGYFNLKSAYPFADCTSCNAPYIQKPCNGKISCEGYRTSYFRK